MHARFALVAVLLFGSAGPSSAAAPTARDEALDLAPPDYALVVVVQNLRDHHKEITDSPFVEWFPSSALGKRLLSAQDVKNVTAGAGPILGALGITPADLIDDILGDAVVFAYTPGTPADPKTEHSVILIRPRKSGTLAAVIGRLNDLQTKSGELKAVTERKHAGAAYFERQKPEGPSEFYCFRDGVFAFSQSEADIRSVLAREKPPKDKPSELASRMTKLGVADAAVAVLVNPRALDAELAAKVNAAPGDERAFLTRFADVWAATDALALYFGIGTDVEAGVSLHFVPEKLPAGVKAWLVGERTPSALWASVPGDALFAAAGRVKPNDVLDVIAQLAPMGGKPGIRESLDATFGPVLGKDKFPLVLDALGPDWGVWVRPPAKGQTAPAVIAAVKVNDAGPKGVEASKALTQALEYGFQVTRVTYNAKHKDQIELKEESHAGAVIKSLTGGNFPPGFTPCFALKSGYLVLSTAPDAIKAFKPPAGHPKPGGDAPLVRFNAAGTRDYLTAQAPQLAKLLMSAGAGEEKALTEQLGNLALVLEPIEKVELLARGDATGLKLMLRVKPVKPLKK
ncbi:MAG TPA: hypothetical protein VGE74_25620 [Gemmata sp.]